MRERSYIKKILSLVVVAGGIVFLSVYYSRQVDFIRFRSITHPIDVSVKLQKKGWRSALVQESGLSCDSVCRIWTEVGSLTRITVLDRGLLVLYGSCDITIYPGRRYFWYIRRGTAAFFPAKDEVSLSDSATAKIPFLPTLYSHKRSVDQGRTVVFKITSSTPLKAVRGSLDWRPIRFFSTIPKKKHHLFHAIQGVDVLHGSGIRRLVYRAIRTDGVWLLRAFPFVVNKRRFFRPYEEERSEVIKIIVKKRRNPSAGRHLWRKWLQKKRFILSEDRPNKEWKMLQKVYSIEPGSRYWKTRFFPPIKQYDRISSRFGKVRYLTSGGGNPHRGVDYAASTGRPVFATARGRVVFAAKTIVRGGLVIIDHGMGVFSTYMHLSRVIARSNTMVYRGQNIGRVGTTGLSTGPHLHFGVRAGNVQVDPGEWMRQNILPVRRWHQIVYSDKVDDYFSE